MTQQLLSWGFIAEKSKFLFTQNLYMNAYSNFTCNNQSLETTRMFFHMWKVKWTYDIPKSRTTILQ